MAYNPEILQLSELIRVPEDHRTAFTAIRLTVIFWATMHDKKIRLNNRLYRLTEVPDVEDNNAPKSC